MGRTTLIAVLGAAVVGSTGGGLAALHFTSPRAAKVDTTPAAGSGVAMISDAAVAGPDAADAARAAPALPTAHASLATQMTTVLSRLRDSRLCRAA